MANREQHIRDALAGVFATTPLTVHIYLGGTPETFNDSARFMAEWHLRTHGYHERLADPHSLRARRVIWARSQEPADLWPEDEPYMRPDTDGDPILEAIVRRYAEAELRRIGGSDHGRT